MAFDAALPPTGWGASPGPTAAWSATAPPAGTGAAGGGAAASSSTPWLDAVTLGGDATGPSALFGELGPDGTGNLYSPASVLGGSTFAAAPAQERDALGAVDEQAQVDGTLLGQPAADGFPGLGSGAAPAGGAPPAVAGLAGDLSSADRGDLLSLQDQWVSAGDGAAQFSQWLGAFTQVAGDGGSGASRAPGLDVVV